jgi:hypothetical protein
MNRIKVFVILLALLPLSNCVMASNNSTLADGANDPILMGSVSDAFSKKPVKGVTIFITSLKDRTERSFTTDDLGNFTIPKFAPGEVTIVLEKKGYKTYRREKILLKEGMQVKLNIDIRNDDADESNVFHPLLRMMDN